MGDLLTSFAKVALTVAVALPLAVYLMQDGLIFYRQPLPEARRADVAKRFPAVREVFLKATDGTKLQAWHAGVGGPLVIYFGGNAEESSWMLEELRQTPGISWLIVSYRGYGLSEGAPSEAALVSDALQWYDHALTLPGTDPKRVYAFGRSLGTGVAVALAADRPLAGVILSTPYDSLGAVARHHYGFIAVEALLKHRFDSLSKAPALRLPLLCLIAERDEVIPPEHGGRLFNAWGGPKRKVILEMAGHNTTDAHPLFWTSIRDFLQQKVN